MGSISGSLVFWKNYYKGYLKSTLKSSTSNPTQGNPYKNIGILNPSIGTSNLGDLIIYESVYKNLRSILDNSLITDFPSQIHTSYDAIQLMAERELLFVSGTNLLSSNLESRNQWKIHNRHKRKLNGKVVLIGCGWWQYQDNINHYTSKIYKNVLHPEILHSVRDGYTLNKLKSIGIQNVVNTSCPTLWSLNPGKCQNIPTIKGKDVVTTLTFYHKNEHLDFQMLEILSNNYDTVYLWIQGMNDLHYFNEIKGSIQNIQLIPPTIEAYNEVLGKGNIDYIGTRLHAGIRALQLDVRTLILAVDNRALEIGKDVNLNVIKREDVELCTEFILNEYRTEIVLPQSNINAWKKSVKSTI